MTTPYNPVPQGVSGTGEAFVLGNSDTALRILQQQEAAARRQAYVQEQAQKKQLQQEAKDYLDASKFNLEGGRIFQKGLTDTVAPEAHNKLIAVYQNKSLTPMQKSMAANEIKMRYEGERQMTLQKQQFTDNFLKTAISDAEINQDTVAFDLTKAIRGQDNQPLRASQFDEEKVANEILGRAQSFNAPVVVQNAIKGIQPAITEAVANAGKIGGVANSRTTTARFYDVDPATGQVRRTKDGSPILNINDESLALLKQNKRFGLLLQDRLDQNSDLDEKQAAADLIGPYATYKETATERRNAQARQGRSGSGAKYAVLASPVQNGFTVMGGNATTGNRVVDPTNISMGDFFAGKAPGTREEVRANFGSYARMDQPTYVTATNPNGKPFKVTGLRTRRLFLPDENGTLRFKTNNDQAIYGEAQDAVAILRNPKTGEYKLAAPDEATARREAADLLNKGWILGTGISIAIPKNKNFAADYSTQLARLQAANDDDAGGLSLSGGGSRKKTLDELKDEAFELAAKGTAQALVPYDEETQGSIDNQTAGSYRSFHQSQGQRGKSLRTTPPQKKPVRGFTDAPKAGKQNSTIKKAGTKSSGTNWD